jgi:hypothetical protein
MASGYFPYAGFQIIVVSLELGGYWPDRISKPLVLKTTLNTIERRRFRTGSFDQMSHERPRDLSKVVDRFGHVCKRCPDLMRNLCAKFHSHALLKMLTSTIIRTKLLFFSKPTLLALAHTHSHNR